MNTSKHLTDLELSHLEETLKRNANVSPRDVLLIMLTLYTGARISEILGLRVIDYNPATKTLFIKGIKGSNDRELPLNAFLDRLLKGYVASLQAQDEMRLFNIGYARAWQIWQLYRPCKKKIHSMRHTRAIKAYKKSRNIHLVKTILGHKSINNTLIYMDYVESQSEIKKALG